MARLASDRLGAARARVRVVARVCFREPVSCVCGMRAQAPTPRYHIALPSAHPRRPDDGSQTTCCSWLPCTAARGRGRFGCRAFLLC
jgi:hypothetical protein